jgi:uncharacterized protein (TIGR00251 family)
LTIVIRRTLVLDRSRPLGAATSEATVDLVSPFRPHPEGTEVSVWVVPGASRTEITGVHDGAVRVRVAAPPEGGKATAKTLRLLATVTNAPVRLLSGGSSRRKRVLVEGVGPEKVSRAFGVAPH